MEGAETAAWLAATVAVGAAFIALIAANYSRRQATAAEGQVVAATEQADTAREQLALMRGDQEDRERREQRDIVIEVLRTGRSYAVILEMMILVMGKMTDRVEITQMDSWGTFTQAGDAYNKARLHARYAVKAPEITAVIKDLETVGAQLTERTSTLLRAERDAHNEAPIEDLLSALDIPHAISDLLIRLEELADQHFTESGGQA